MSAAVLSSFQNQIKFENGLTPLNGVRLCSEPITSNKCDPGFCILDWNDDGTRIRFKTPEGDGAKITINVIAGDQVGSTIGPVMGSTLAFFQTQLRDKQAYNQ